MTSVSVGKDAPMSELGRRGVVGGVDARALSWAILIKVVLGVEAIRR